MKKCKIITIANQKGGVGKTTTTVNLGIGLVMQGNRVLLVDIDPQSDLTTSLGWTDGDSLSVTITDFMESVIKDANFDYSSAILMHEEGVDLIPSNIELSGMEINLVNAMSREYVLKKCLEQIEHEYDFIIIDCPPSLSMLTINALAAADSIIVPVVTQYLPVKGMTQLMKTIGKVRKHINPSLEVEGILLNLADMRTNLARVAVDTLQQQYGDVLKIFNTKIPVAVRAAETSTTGKSIYTYDRGSKVALAYEEFTKEVLGNA